MDAPVEHDGSEPYDRSLEARVTRVEHDVNDIKDTLADMKAMMARMEARLDAVLPHLATKADVAQVEARLDVMKAELDATLPHLATRADLAEKPSKTYMWGVMTALLPAYACGLAALAALK